MHIMQVKSWKYMLQTSENYSSNQDPSNKENLEDFSQYSNTVCQIEYDIYLMECTKCNLQYDGKDETPVKIRLNNHMKDFKDPKMILVEKLFQKNVIDLTNT